MSRPDGMIATYCVTLDAHERELFERYGPLDARPGFYYVSIGRDDGSDAKILARGPFATHREAILAIPGAKRAAERVDVRACWYSYGTARSETDQGSGKLDREA
jgi:hypothetical protein